MRSLFFLFAVSTVLLMNAWCVEQAETAKQERLPAINPDLVKEVVLTEVEVAGNHPWAGEYHASKGLGYYYQLILSPTSFYAQWTGCLGVYEQYFGEVSVESNLVRLTRTDLNKSSDNEWLAMEYLWITWGKRVYLVEPDLVIHFCNFVNAGREPRKDWTSTTFLRSKDDDARVTGLPDVPSEYRKYFLPRPVTARVTVLGKSSRADRSDMQLRETETSLEIVKGEGLLPEMRMHLIGQDGVQAIADITRVDGKRVDAIITQSRDKRIPRVEVGWTFSTADGLDADERWF